MNNGPLGSSTHVSVVDGGTGPRSLQRPPGTTSAANPTPSHVEQIARGLANSLSSALGTPEVQKALYSFIGSDSFSAGVVYGMTRNLVVSVYQLGTLFKTLALAEYDDMRRAQTFWQRMRHAAMYGPTGVMVAVDLYTASLFWPQLDRTAHEAALQRDALVESIKYSFEHPGEVFRNVQKSTIAKYEAFKTLVAKKTIAGNFQAGTIFGELLLDVLLIADGVTALARLATRFPELLKLLPTMREIAPVLRDAVEESRGAAKAADAAAARPAAGAKTAARPGTAPRTADATSPAKAPDPAARAADPADPVPAKKIPSYDELKDMAANSLDFGTKQDGAVFWSGDGNMVKAQEWASSVGKTTLEQTQGGQYLNDLDLFNNMDKGQAADVWNIASKRFAEGASGDVTVFNEGATQFGQWGERTWWKTELPALQANPDVTSITEWRSGP